MKNHIMNSTSADEKALIGLDELSLSYNYQLSTSITEQRTSYDNSCVNKNYYNKTFKPFDLVNLSYKTIEFNMITCPAGGKVNIYRWGLQEIKEPFMLAETEVTQELFEAVMYFNYSDFKDSNKNPVENVTWFDCLEFCNRLSDYFGLDRCYILNNKEYTNSDYPLSIEEANAPLSIEEANDAFEKANAAFIIGANGFRLPKQWEWQIAAMAGTNNEYAGANDDESLKRVAWFNANSGYKTHLVAQKLPNEWGFYDMSGNVGEWCENSENPNRNNNHSADRSIRGGGCYNIAWDLRSAKLDYNTSPSIRRVNLGFRVARSI